MSLASVDTLAAIADPIARASEAARLDAYHRQQAHLARKARDAALREAFDGGVSKPQLAGQTGINIATVKAVLR